MDMRTFGKTFQRYRDQAEDEGGVRFERCRVHSVEQDRQTNDLLIKYIDTHGDLKESRQDVVVLAVGQRPAAGGGERHRQEFVAFIDGGLIIALS